MLFIEKVVALFVTSLKVGADSETESGSVCLTLCDPMDYTLHGILQAKILEYVAIPFSRKSCQPRGWTQVSRIAGGFFTIWDTREDQSFFSQEKEMQKGKMVV